MFISYDYCMIYAARQQLADEAAISVTIKKQASTRYQEDDSMEHFQKNQRQEHIVSKHSCCMKNRAMNCVVELITAMQSSSGSMIRSSAARLLRATDCWTKLLQIVLEKRNDSSWGRGITRRWVIRRGERNKPVVLLMQMRN